MTAGRNREVKRRGPQPEPHSGVSRTPFAYLIIKTNPYSRGILVHSRFAEICRSAAVRFYLYRVYGHLHLDTPLRPSGPLLGFLIPVSVPPVTIPITIPVQDILNGFPRPMLTDAVPLFSPAPNKTTIEKTRKYITVSNVCDRESLQKIYLNFSDINCMIGTLVCTHIQYIKY